MKRNKHYAFTLIELLVVIVIIGVLLAAAVPNFRNVYSNFLLSDAASNLAYDMRYARARSIIERKSYKLNFDSLRKKYWITRETSDSFNPDGFERIKSTYGKIQTLPENIDIDTHVYQVMFYPNGSIDDVVLYLRNKNNKVYTLKTNGKSGYIEIFEYEK